MRSENLKTYLSQPGRPQRGLADLAPPNRSLPKNPSGSPDGQFPHPPELESHSKGRHREKATPIAFRGLGAPNRQPLLHFGASGPQEGNPYYGLVHRGLKMVTRIAFRGLAQPPQKATPLAHFGASRTGKGNPDAAGESCSRTPLRKYHCLGRGGCWRALASGAGKGEGGSILAN